MAATLTQVNRLDDTVRALRELVDDKPSYQAAVSLQRAVSDRDAMVAEMRQQIELVAWQGLTAAT